MKPAGKVDRERIAAQTQDQVDAEAEREKAALGIWRMGPPATVIPSPNQDAPPFTKLGRIAGTKSPKAPKAAP